MLGHLTVKSDVYSFGVVLLEVISGRRAVDKNLPPGEHNLVEWARPYLSHKRKVFRVIDSRLEGQYSPTVAQKAALLALLCISTDARIRPSMDEVVTTLEQLQDTRSSARSPVIEPTARARSVGYNEQRSRRRSDECSTGTRASYPRPSASPLYL